MFELYATIWRVSARRQLLLIALSLAVAGLAAVPLSYQKDIINGLTAADVSEARLVELCAEMMGLILLSLGLKWALGFRANTLGEDVIRRIRRRLYISSTDPDTDVSTASGSLATMVSAEAEELGKFAGSAISEPVVQLGTMFSVIAYIATAQPVLGLLSFLIIAPQAVLVLVTQAKVNACVAKRVRILRQSTKTIVSEDLRALNDAVLKDFDDIYETRRVMFLWKLSTKFLLSSISAAGTVGLLLLGGLYVLKGHTDVGTVVAATMGLARLQGPATFLIAFYRQVSATKVKYDLLKSVVLPHPKTGPASP